MHELSNYLAALGPYECIGVAGFICYIAAFGSVQFGLMDGNGPRYSMTNVLAASLVGISLIAEFNLASALIQGSWIIIGLTGLTMRIFRVAAVKHQSPIQTFKTEVL